MKNYQSDQYLAEEIQLLQTYVELYPAVPSGLRWLKQSGRSKIGKPAGTLRSDGYYQIQICQKLYYCHRIILLLNGVLPTEKFNVVDHIDRNRSNNLITNLRWVSQSANSQNRNVVGTVHWRYVRQRRPNRFEAQYRDLVTKKTIQVGAYSDAYKAHCSALAHRLENHWID